MSLHMYTSLVRPHLEYASSVWSPYLKKHCQTKENVQQRAIKLIRNISHLSCKDRLQYTCLPSLEYRRTRSNMLPVF